MVRGLYESVRINEVIRGNKTGVKVESSAERHRPGMSLLNIIYHCLDSFSYNLIYFVTYTIEYVYDWKYLSKYF